MFNENWVTWSGIKTAEVEHGPMNQLQIVHVYFNEATGTGSMILNELYAIKNKPVK